jgi:hypothetical protein
VWPFYRHAAVDSGQYPTADGQRGGWRMRSAAAPISDRAGFWSISWQSIGPIHTALAAGSRRRPARNKCFQGARSAGVLPSRGRRLGRPATRWYRAGSDLAKAIAGCTGRRPTQWLPRHPRALRGTPTLPSQRRLGWTRGRALAAGPCVHLRFPPNPCKFGFVALTQTLRQNILLLFTLHKLCDGPILKVVRCWGAEIYGVER